MSASNTMETIENKLDRLEILVLRLMGARLDTAAMCERLQVSRNTLAKMEADGRIPPRGKDGKWLTAEVVEFEMKK